MLKFKEQLCFMTMTNDAKFEKELTRCFKIDMRNLTNFDPNTPKYQKFALSWAPFDKSICLSQKRTEELCLMPLKYNAKFKRKLTCAYKNDMKNLANFHRLKNRDFILESKMGEIDQNGDSKQPN